MYAIRSYYDWRNHELYASFRKVAERALRQTSTADAPWTIIEGYDFRYRNLTLGKALLQALQHRLKTHDEPAPRSAVPPIVPHIDRINVIRNLDLSLALDKKEYEDELAHWQGKLNRLTRRRKFVITSYSIHYTKLYDPLLLLQFLKERVLLP